MDAPRESPEQEALTRIERAMQAYEDAGYPISQLDAYRKLVKEAAALRAAVASQTPGRPITEQIRQQVRDEVDGE